MMNVQKYPAYKNSGVEWIETVPSHWEVVKLKRLFCEKKKITNVDLPCGSISFGKVVYKDEEKIPEATKKSYQAVSKGEYLLNPLNLNYDLISLRIALSDKDVVVSSGYIVLNSIVKLDKTYFKWLLHRYDVAFMKTLGSGVRQTINFSDIGDSELIFPPLPEQTAIAQFLDRKTALIDQAIDIKQKQIELLKERRQILIHQAVTRGLNPEVKMKASGVEWIGEVPEGWEVVRLKTLGKIKYGLGQPPKTKEDGLPLIRATNVERGRIVEKDLIFVDPEDIPWERDPMLKENDIIVVRSGAYTGDSAIIPKHYAGSIAGYDMVLTPTSINPRFLSYTLLAKYVLYDQLYLLRMRAAQPHLNAEELGQTIIVCPPKLEQQQIFEYLENISKKIATAITLKQQEIAKLQEYKATLINSAVTGKIKVGSHAQ
ncbi:restriction endonuclease subunit S [Haliscomenobacter hydrossis]|uniref:Restriction modification system DNA specificity domain protein n=1 Tax=Haliscomenobacter hydrossis (strain ATCC 27775 / DSM 1100 / LMG 10767 / O) TaxID=760192 RepID=F4L012_HALH1|nr:restriction endonuclease subunit S [Haliscomenobacter hydrossis]AEE52721.1 restriction modification system DNA specificity domain protein [Haliscomenobacter hydrossis DSM 1100]